MAKPTKSIRNKRAVFDYELKDQYIVGLALTGAETKALRHNQGSLVGAYVTIKDNELWLINATISGNNRVPISEDEQTKTRKLLAKSKEIKQLIEAKNSGLTILPIELLTQGRYIKLKISTGRGKKLHDKRATIKKRDEQRKIQNYEHHS